MARLKDLDEWIDPYLQFLKEVYFETDPEKGENREIAKHELAQLAIENFWYLQGKLLGWAQAHLTGHSILKENPELVGFLEERLGYLLHEDSHELEQIGLLYNFNPPDDECPALRRMEELLTEFGVSYLGEGNALLTPAAMRRTIRELLMSRCADNSYWRHDLQNSLDALNEGEVDELFTPTPGKRQGLPYSLNRWKLEALKQVRFRIGKGYKKYRALEEIGEAIGQSPETLRTWEKALRKNTDREVNLYCSELAGIFDPHFSGDQDAPIPSIEDYDSWRGMNYVDHARYLHRNIVKRKLEDIRDAINHFRQKENGS